MSLTDFVERVNFKNKQKLIVNLKKYFAEAIACYIDRANGEVPEPLSRMFIGSKDLDCLEINIGYSNPKFFLYGKLPVGRQYFWNKCDSDNRTVA